jgi:hypothetical protein
MPYLSNEERRRQRWMTLKDAGCTFSGSMGATPALQSSNCDVRLLKVQ